MAKRLNAQQRSELERLMKSCIITLDFMAERSDFPPAALSAGREGLQRAYEAGDLRGLRMAERDFLEWTGALAPQERDELETRLRVLAGHDRDTTREQERKRVEAALNRGRIASEAEYRAAMARLDEIAGDPERSDEADRLEALTSTFGRKL